MNKFRDTTTEFYKDLKAGRADQKDFERHIYGQFGAKSYNKDSKDFDGDKAYNEAKKIENDVMDYVRAEEAKANRQ